MSAAKRVLPPRKTLLAKRPPIKRPARPRRIPNNAGRLVRSPRHPTMAEMQYVTALEQSAERFGRLIMNTLIPPLSALAREHLQDQEHYDAKHKDKGGLSNHVLTAANEAGIDTQGLSEEEVLRLVRKYVKKLRNDALDDFPAAAIEHAAAVTSARVLKTSQREFKRLAIDVRKEPTLTPLIDGWRHDNVSLIRNMQKDQLDKVEGVLRGGYGRRAESLAKDIEHHVGVSKSRSELIARDQVLKLHGKITHYRQKAAGINKYVWTTSNDSRVRESHVELEGETFSWDGGGDPDEGHPGEAINCLPGNATITHVQGHIRRAFRRWYNGELTTLVTDSGESFDCTPNHPILTARGWLPAHALDVGDHVFEARHQMGSLAKLDVEHGDACVEDVFDVLSLVSDRHRVAGGGAQFHGDGRADQEVDVVDAEHGLLLNLEPTLTKNLCEIILTESKASDLRARGFYLALIAMGFAADRVVRSLAQRLAFFWSRTRHPREHRGASSPQLHAFTFQEVRDGIALHPEVLRERLDRGTLGVTLEAHLLGEAFRVVRRSVVTEGLNTTSAECLGEIVRVASESRRDLSEEHPALKHPLRIVEKRVRQFEGHVFNLETSSGWYGANTIAQKNCRCVAFPLLDIDFGSYD